MLNRRINSAEYIQIEYYQTVLGNTHLTELVMQLPYGVKLLLAYIYCD